METVHVCQTDWALIATLIGSAMATIAFIYAVVSNLRSDITKLEDRMFWLATGKTIQQAILEERLKKDL